ncbi:hypothetical protein [Jeotgalibaca sp. A122]|uniref:hypothetical protein n=1 Tax=Jeotgalibaca sp. A122 TaxID=3457322 RepID=UPI003FCF2B9F
MHLAKWEWKKMLRDWKTRILLMGFFLFFGSFSLLYQQQNLSFPEEEMNEQYQTIHNIFNSIPKSVFEGPDGQEVYDTLAELQSLYGMQLYILSKRDGNTITGFENVFDSYLENGAKIAENNAALLTLTDFEHYDFLISYLPDAKAIHQDVAFFDYMEKHGLDIEWNAFSASNIFLKEVNMMVGIVLFLFVALLGCDRFTRDQTKNWSITHGLPIPWRKQWHIRSAQLWLVMWMVSLGGLLMSYVISLLLESPGSLWYPVIIYANNGYLPIAIWQYALLAISIAMLLSYFLLLVAVGLSWVFRTIYLTLIVTLSTYFIPVFWQVVKPFSSWQPSLYFHIESVLMGEMAQTTGLQGVYFWKGLVLMAVIFALVEILFAGFFDRIQTQTLGLRRRVNI